MANVKLHCCRIVPSMYRVTSSVRHISSGMKLLYAGKYPWKKEEKIKKAFDPTPVALQYVYKKSDMPESSTLMETSSENGVENLAKTLQKIEWDLQALKFKAQMLERRREMLDTENLEVSSLSQFEDEKVKPSEDSDKGEESTKEKHVKGYMYGTPDPDFPPTSIPCGGCGAHLHCQDAVIPGYVASEKLKSSDSEELKSLVCQRCFLMTNSNYILDISADATDFHRVIKTIKKERALVLVIVDVTDMKNSIIENLMPAIGSRRPIYVLGNKIDLIPKDETGYLERIEEDLCRCCEDAGLNPSKNIRHVALVSGKTGYGIEELISKLMIEWQHNGNVYLVGSANAGKSTLFNALLGSDYCKTDVRDVIKRATVSHWPGTTLQLIKFPIVTPTPWRLTRRRRRLYQTRQEETEIQRLRASRLRFEGRSKNAILSGSIGITDMRREEEKLKDNIVPSVENWSTIEFKEDMISDSAMVSKKSSQPATKAADETLFPESKWLHDTPGLLKDDQLYTHLTAPELRVIVQHKIIRPRVFLMKPGETMFVTGLATVEYLQGVPATHVTVHTALQVPVHIVNTTEAAEFYNENVGTDVLGIPIGDQERISKLPPLVGETFAFTSFSKEYASADIQLSSLGWVSVCAREGADITMRASTTAGLGMYLRQPALLPNFQAFKGKRLGRSPSYNIKKLT